MGAARAVVGAVALAKPPIVATALGLDSGTAERTDWLARFFGGRDFALGVGSAAGSRGCQAAACASDLSDFVAVLLAMRAGHVKALPGVLTAITAGGAALAGAATLIATRG